MKSNRSSAFVLVVALAMAFCGELKAQEQKSLDIIEFAEQEADKLQRLLDLEDWQVFYVDSTLKANYVKLQSDYESLQKSKVANTSIYQDFRDECQDRIDAAYKMILTEEQWARYLKSGAAKQQKQREKRREKK